MAASGPGASYAPYGLLSAGLQAFFQPEKQFLLVTREAKCHENCLRIKEELGDRLQLITIPPGKTEAELWQLFEIISDFLPNQARVILDVTHAFRSLPFVTFGVINYLRRTNEIHLERIVYGAFDAREPGPENVCRAPVFDLTMLVDLQEWLNAVDAFTMRSDGEKLAYLLKEAHRRPWLAGRRENGDLPRRLYNMATGIEDFSRSIRLLRPLDALEAAARVRKLAAEVEPEAERWAKPFSRVLSMLTDELDAIATETPHSLDAEGLRRQLALIEHYIKKDLIVQAVLLEREWLVNWLAWRIGEKNWRNRDVRERKLERAMSRAVSDRRKAASGDALDGARFWGGEVGTEIPDTEDEPDWFEGLPEAENVADLWGRLIVLRNDVAHCAMNDNPAGSDSIRGRAAEMVSRLGELL